VLVCLSFPPPSLHPGTVAVPITQNWWYSTVHYFWPVEELAELAEGPAGCVEVASGGCSFAWNVLTWSDNKVRELYCPTTYVGREE